MTATKLAMFGGERAVPRDAPRAEWPRVLDEDRAAVLRVLDSGKLVSHAPGEPEVAGLEREFAELAGARHCVGVSNGTAAITLALAALGIGRGEEVLVPALTFVGTALGVMHAGATPVFVDVDPLTFNIDPTLSAAAVTDRTRAIVAVHLHGLPAEMEELRRIAERHGLALIEDAAQAHGASYRGRSVGSIGDIACFSLNATKNLPTCGEGGLVTGNDVDLIQRVRLRRQFGEEIDETRGRSYRAHVIGWNAKLSPIQAAFTRAQLARFPEYARRREANARRLLRRLDALPGLVAPRCPGDRTHDFHILRFRLDPVAAGLEGVSPAGMRQAVHRVLRAEGVPMSRYQLSPLAEQEAFRAARWPGGSGEREPADSGPAHPATSAIIGDSLTLQKRHLDPEAGPLLELYAAAFEKAWDNLEAIRRLAGRPERRPGNVRGEVYAAGAPS